MNRRDFLTGTLAGCAAVGRLAVLDAAEAREEPPEPAYWLPAVEEGRRLLADLPGAAFVCFPGLRWTETDVHAVQYMAQRVPGGWRLLEGVGNDLVTRHTQHER